MDIYYLEDIVQRTSSFLNSKKFKEAALQLNKIHYGKYKKIISVIKLTRPRGLVNLFSGLIESLNYYYSHEFDILHINVMYNIIRSYQIKELDQLLPC